MNTIHRIHIKYRTLSTIEDYYSSMARKGLILVKRGLLFSSFKQTSPMNIHYQAIVIDPNHYFSHEEDMNQKLDSLDGWNYVTHFFGTYIYQTILGNPLNHFYSNDGINEVQSKPIKHFFDILTRVILSFLVFYVCLRNSAILHSWSYVWSDLRLSFYLYTPIYLLIALILLGFIGKQIFLSFYISPYKHILKNPSEKVNALIHNTNRKKVYRYTRYAYLIGFCINIVFCIVMYIETRSSSMPIAPDTPYITFDQIDISGKRTTLPLSKNNESQVSLTHSYFTNTYDTIEYYDSNDGLISMYQNVYQIKRKSCTKHLLKLIKDRNENDLLSSSYQQINVKGFDQVYITTNTSSIFGQNGTKYLCQKGNTIWEISIASNVALSTITEKEIFDTILKK